MPRKILTNVDVAVLALAQLGGATKKIHSEEIAARAFDLAPEKFSWRLPQYRSKGWPDKELVRAALVNAQTNEYGELVNGASNTDLSKDGWRLTAAGTEWVIANERRILDGLSADEVIIPKREALRYCKKLKSEPLFKRYQAEQNLKSATPYDFTDLLECSPDAPKDILRTKFDRLLATAHVVKDVDILSFLESCRSRFPDLLTTSQESERPR